MKYKKYKNNKLLNKYNIELFEYKNVQKIILGEKEPYIDFCLEFLKNNKFDIIIDLGTGTGLILLSILKNLDYKPLGIGLDFNNYSIDLAKYNSNINNINNSIFLFSDVLDIFIKNRKKWEFFKGKRIFIISTLPYSNNNAKNIKNKYIKMARVDETGYGLIKKFFIESKKIYDIYKPSIIFSFIAFGDPGFYFKNTKGNFIKRPNNLSFFEYIGNK